MRQDGGLAYSRAGLQLGALAQPTWAGLPPSARNGNFAPGSLPGFAASLQGLDQAQAYAAQRPAQDVCWWDTSVT